MLVRARGGRPVMEIPSEARNEIVKRAKERGISVSECHHYNQTKHEDVHRLDLDTDAHMVLQIVQGVKGSEK